MIRRYPFIRASLESVFLWEVDFRPDVLLVGDRRSFLQMAGHDAFVPMQSLKGGSWSSTIPVWAHTRSPWKRP